MATRIVLLPGPNFAQRVTSAGVEKISIRESERCDDFLKELAEEANLPGVIHEGDYQPCKEEILICWPDALEQVLAGAEERTSIASKSVLVGVARNRAVKEAESNGLAAAIDSAAYSQWLINYPRAETALYGLRRIQDLFDAETSSSPSDRGNNYVRYVAPAGVMLPRCLGLYIRALLAGGWLV